MNSIKNLKKISLIIFFLMIVPFGKLVMLNCVDLSIDIFFFYDSKGFPLRHLFLFLCLLGIYFIYFKNKYYVVFGFFLTYLWLIYKIDYVDLKNSLPVSVSISIYITISIYTSFKVLKEASSQK
ncbi:MAG: hypothetical protein GW839_05210 [Flavobacteriales bacterium]|nr:hypothetical protein [Flavobacteriales bacterium]NCQ58452.1 hypothetical protein [Flavobacteriales bacterium]NCT15892.1 hypothetical protein [Flavobacteriales bacterium]